jgi:ABC-type multidrug transport system ATPase subunit
VSTALAFQAVVKQYGRRGVRALDAFTCTFPTGALCGLVGPNGAGKTTAFSIVGGYLRPDSGRVEILGRDGFDPWQLKGHLGVLPQDAELGPRHTPRELLQHLARLQGLGRTSARKETERVLDVVGLTDRRNKRIGSLSHGMRRRVAVASALIGQPDLVLLDEPTAGLDPVQARSLREALLERRAGQTVVVSSHNLEELERICDWVVMMDSGKCLREGSVADVTGRQSTVVWELVGAAPLDALATALPAHTFALDGELLTQTAPVGGDLDASSVQVMAVLAAAAVPVRGVRRGIGLEKRFFDDH